MKKQSPSQRWPALRASVLGRLSSAASRFLHRLAGGVALTITLFFWQALAAHEDAEIQRKTQLEAASVKIELANQMQQLFVALVSLGKRWENCSKPSQKQWQAEAALYVLQRSGYLAIQWADSELNTSWTVRRQAYQAAEKLSPALAAQRQALVALPSRRQDLTVTGSANLAQGGKTFLVSVPIFSQAPQCTGATRGPAPEVGGRLPNPKSATQNPKTPDGYILGVLSTQELLDGTLNQNIRRGYTISIFLGDREIYRSNRAGKPNPKWVKEEKIEFYGTTWRVRVMPAPDLLALQRSPLPEVALGAGIAVAFLLTLAVRLAQTAHFSRKQLEATSQQLQTEITSRERAVADALARAEELAALCETLRNQTLFLQSILERSGDGATVALEGGNQEPGATAASEAEISATNSPAPEGIWAGPSATPLTDEPAAIQESIAAIRDITQSVGAALVAARAQEAPHSQARRFRNLVETASDWVWEVDESGAYTYSNPKVIDLLGFLPEEVLGKTPFDLMPPEEAFRAANMFGPIVAKHQPFSCLENTNLHKDGRLVVLETSGVPVFDSEGKLLGYRGINRDITHRVRVLQALRQSEEIYRLLVEGVRDYAIFMLDPSGHVVSWNRAAERIKGYRTEEIIGKHFSCYYQLEDIQQGKPQRLLERAAASGKVEDEGWRVRADGSRFWANVVITALRDDSGVLRGFAKMTRDITERKQAAEALRESEERYRSAIETAAEGIVLLYADGRSSTCNASAERILGLSAHQMTGRTSLALRWSAIHEDGSPFPAEIHPAMVTLRTGEPQSNVVMGVRKPEGIVTWISVNARPLFRPKQREPYGVVFSFFDITERKQAEEVLRFSDELLKQMPDSIVLTDLEGTIQKWMGKSEQIFGFAASEVIGKPLNFLYRHDSKGVTAANIINQIQETGVFGDELLSRKKNGAFIEIETTAKAFCDTAGKPLFLIAIHRDISERKRTEEALQQANQQLKAWVKELEERNDEISLLSHMSDLLQTCLTREEACKVIAQVVPLLFPNNSGAVFTISNSRNLVEAITTWGRPVTSQTLFSTHECIGLRRGQPHLVEDTRSGLLCNHLERDFLPSGYFCIPMAAQGETLGVLYLSFMEPGQLTRSKQQLAVTVARQISLSLANLKLYESLQHQSIRDPLTGLFNRRYLEESLTREIHRASREQQSLGIIMLDVDHFKRFNDTFGHEAGDAVLRELGLFLKQHIRSSDIACRYGGEEFMLILPEASLEHTQERAEGLREGVKHLNMEHHRQPLGGITLSLGVAVFPEHGLAGEAVIRAADAALYRAKILGRDRSVTAS
ncbi:PAS domain S-box protein [Kamptonema formosum]|uniref:PAS domain S-box protein n=1 Tax=Kamptonema formosum TaxID=331992 RepID=UPI000344CCE5|nr:PAS domain S-box protein [Oscillatoria sp. PCC 10802]